MSQGDRKNARLEAKIMKLLNHQNIIQFKEAFKDNRRNLNLVMEYADGGTLAALIKTRQ